MYFERKILGLVYGRDSNIQVKKFTYRSHVIRKEVQEVSEKVLSTRIRVRLRMHWRDEVNGDAGIFGIRNWWMVGRDADEWKGFLEKVKNQK